MATGEQGHCLCCLPDPAIEKYQSITLYNKMSCTKHIMIHVTMPRQTVFSLLVADKMQHMSYSVLSKQKDYKIRTLI